MFSGKSDVLIKAIKRLILSKGGDEIIVFKPSIDTRQNNILSRTGANIPAISIDYPIEAVGYIKEETVVCFDEVQFFDDSIVKIIEELIKEGKTVICSGLDLNSNGQPFGPMPKLLAFADKVRKLKAVCEICKEDATRTYKTSGSDKLIEVGSDIYIPLCNKCFYKKFKG